MAYKNTSHLRKTPITNGYTELYNPAVIPDFNNSSVFEITQKYDKRPDILAYDLYNEPKFWWLFAVYNKNSIVDPINDFTIGKRINVPNRNIVAGI
jgi:hypothetical protein